MNAVMSRTVTPAALFVLIFGFGILLSRSGKPYNGILFNLHKLIALGSLVFLAVTVTRHNQAQPLSTPQIFVSVLAALCFVVTIITGGLVSVEKTLPPVVTLAHKLMPYLTLLSSAATLYLLRG